RRTHDRRDVVRAIRRVEERLGAGRDMAAAMLHEVTDLDPELRTPRLARRHHLPAEPQEPLGEQCRLGRLPGAVAALERDEAAGQAFAFGLAFVAVFGLAFAAALPRGAAGPRSRRACSSATARS